jgi:DNA-binding transcriptional MocR family regulator
VVILSSRAQNPTGICTTAERASQLRRIAASAPNTLFIDDDHSSLLQLNPYHGYLAGSAARWMVIRSVSKFLGPDLRVAVSRGDDITIGRLERAQSYSMGWVSMLLQNLSGALLHDRQVRALVRKAGVTYVARYRALQSQLGTLGLTAPGTAGLNIWVPCADEGSVTQILLAHGWKVRSGSDFTIQSQAGFRVTTASLDDPLRADFVQALEAAMDRQGVLTA